MKIGYARVSTKDQVLDLQLDALRKEGCEKIYKEKVSALKRNRKELVLMLNNIQPGDVVVIWKLDRLGRSLRDLIEIVNELHKRQAGIKSLNDPIDTTTAQGRLVFNIFASLAEFEREIIRDRTMAGLEAARARGRLGGRPKGLTPDGEKTALAAASLYRDKNYTVSKIIDKLGVSKSTLYKYLRLMDIKIGSNEP